MSDLPRIILNFEDGRVFSVPASYWAQDRANYYIKKDGFELGGSEWLDEVRYALSHEGFPDLLDWIQNNSDPDEIEKQAILVRGLIPVTFAEGLNSADWSIHDPLNSDKYPLRKL